MANIEYDFQKIEKKWQDIWEKEKIFEVEIFFTQKIKKI